MVGCAQGMRGGAAPPAEPAPQSAPEAERAAEKTRGYHLHDGYFMCFAGGVGYVHLEFEMDGAPATLSARGAGIGWQFDFGGALAGGVVLGGGYSGVVATDADVEGGAAASSEGSATFVMLGAFLSVFPDPRGGLELGGKLALALADETSTELFGDTSVDTGALGGPGVALPVWPCG